MGGCHAPRYRTRNLVIANDDGVGTNSQSEVTAGSSEKHRTRVTRGVGTEKVKRNGEREKMERESERGTYIYFELCTQIN